MFVYQIKPLQLDIRLIDRTDFFYDNLEFDGKKKEFDEKCLCILIWLAAILVQIFDRVKVSLVLILPRTIQKFLNAW